MKTTSKTIEVLVGPDGQTRVETKGFSGSSCLEVSCFLEAALGTLKSSERTAAFHATAGATSVELGTSESSPTQLS